MAQRVKNPALSLAAAQDTSVAWVQSLAGEFPHAVGVSKKKKKDIIGVPAVVQQDWRHLGSTGTQVQSLARHRGLRSQCCHSCSSNLILGLETPHAAWQQKKKKKKKTWHCKSTICEINKQIHK